MNAAPYLAVDGIRKTYRETVALHGVSLTVRKGEFLALLGPSGCGKTTLLRILAGLLDADSGTLSLDGAPIDGLPAYRRDIGIVFQNYALFPHMSVAENVAFGLKMRGLPRAESEARVREALDLVNLGGLETRMPSELSGGQQQRVALARAVAIRPRLLLLDEPLSNLDAVLRTRVRVDIRELHERTGVTTIMVTHDQAEAMTLADRIAVMSAGAVLQHDTPERIYEEPARAFVASFIGSPPAALLPVSPAGDGLLRVGGTEWRPEPALYQAVAATRRPKVLLGIRPEDLAVTQADADGGLIGRLRSVEYLGAERLVHVDVGGEALTARIGEPLDVAGENLGLVLRKQPAIFDADSGERL
jgi:ABC-type sugar transport system ATPase subunit